MIRRSERAKLFGLNFYFITELLYSHCYIMPGITAARAPPLSILVPVVLPHTLLVTGAGVGLHLLPGGGPQLGPLRLHPLPAGVLNHGLVVKNH